ncbi:MAG: hypothetical protein ACI4RA_05110 [Kiritimatiellia bacterium]
MGRTGIQGLLAGALLAAGCVSMPERSWERQTFELPYLLDYDVVNRARFVWRDDFLARSSFAYSQELAGPLSALAACVYGYRSDMDRHSLAALGFNTATLLRRYGDDLDYNHPEYGKNQVGFTFATKRVLLEGELRDVLFVLVRGTFGRDEWLSNMNICNSWGRDAAPDPARLPALHEGFDTAANAVQKALEAYVVSNRIELSSAKVVVTGHSRGAAVANILGARLDDGTMLAGVRPGNVFVYTFAAPNTVLGPEVENNAVQYANIFNVLNPEDVVPLVPVVKWHARRFGTDLVLKNYDELSLWEVWTDPGYNEMKDEFRRMTGYEWWHTPFGTNSTLVVPALLGAVAPTVPDLYAIPSAQRADGNLTSIHSILETIIYRSMKDSKEQERDLSLGDDVRSLTGVYTTVHEANDVEEPTATGLYLPDGRDFTRQPGMFDVLWRLSCMHATQTYIGWMKAAELHGPGAVYKNWYAVAP